MFAFLIMGALSLEGTPYIVQELLVGLLLVAVPFVLFVLMVVAYVALREGGRRGIRLSQEFRRACIGKPSQAVDARGDLIR